MKNIVLDEIDEDFIAAAHDDHVSTLYKLGLINASGKLEAISKLKFAKNAFKIGVW